MAAFGWLKPEYIFQPRSLLRRLRRASPPEGLARFTLPGGLPICIDSRDQIARSLHLFGVYDLVTTEALWRLLEPGNCGVDVGANVGYTAGVMANRLRPGGSLFCFEPHPDLFARLVQNIARWQRLIDGIRVQCFQMAASSAASRVTLVIPEGFDSNQGLARVAAPDEVVPNGFEVDSARLDDMLGHVPHIDMMKLDVEGHEYQVLSGASRLIRSHRVRDVIFEEYNAYPAGTFDFLERNGYEIFRLEKALLGPRLSSPRHHRRRARWEPPNYLATIAPARAQQRMRPPGWQVLRPTIWAV